MTVIDLSTLTFTKQNDTVPESGIVQITNTGTAKTLNGDDSIIASAEIIDPNQTGPITLINRGTIDTGNGDDTIDSTGGRYASGMLNYGPIYTGNGNDTITVSSGRGASSENHDIIDSGRGNDTLSFGGGESFRNYGSIYTNNGDDTITSVNLGYGIYNEGVISTSNGNDMITGSAAGDGIFNNGTIDTGNGNDVVDTSTSNGGFGGTGTTLLGNGEDVLEGFGSGYFDAGEDNDTLLIGAPYGSITYTVSSSANSDGFYTINNGIENMFVKNFEFIGSFRDPAAAFSFSSAIGGTFTV